MERVFWIIAVLGAFQMTVAGFTLAARCLEEIVVLAFAYGIQYSKHHLTHL